MFEILLPDDVVVASMVDNAGAAPLLPEEEAYVARAVEKRRQEFTAGRHCAREALRRLGAPVGPIPVTATRAPVWPESVAGSITHCTGLTAAAVGWASRYAGIGIDAEPAEPLSAGLERLICTPAERERLSRMDTPEIHRVRLVFCAKETVHKAIAPMSGVTLGFHDVEIDFTAAGEFAVRLVGARDERLPPLDRIRGRHALTDELILAAATLLRSS